MSLLIPTMLPQFDPAPAARQSQLARTRESFQYDFSVVRNVPIAAAIPQQAKPSPAWSAKIIATAYRLRRNWERITDTFQFRFEQPLPQKSLGELAAMLAAKDLKGILAYADPDLGVALDHQRPTSYTEYFQLFQQLNIPEGTRHLEDEDAFADYFLTGLNPLLIRVMTEIPAKLALTDAHLTARASLANDSIAKALGEGRLYCVDYAALSGLTAGSHPNQPKYVYAPIVVLAVPPGGGNLEVVGVQTGQDGALYPFVTPSAGRWDWLVAMTIARSADSTYHEVVSHLSMTHLVMEPIALATYRQLAEHHPLHRLIAPHCEGTLPINALAVRLLINQGGRVDQLLPADLESGHGVIETIRNAYDFRASFLRTDLAARGVDQQSTLASYPYRDDALLIWDAITGWVSDYVDLYYASDAAVAADAEIANWAAEIGSPDFGRVRGFAPEGGIVTKTTLVETLTMILFTASAQHAAVNYPQAVSAAVPYQPLAGYAPAPTRLGLTEADALDFLPPLDRAIKQVHTLTLLGDTYYTQLGLYAPTAFNDARVMPALWRFQKQLLQCEWEIEQRNKGRRTAYPYLRPSRIPQSINI